MKVVSFYTKNTVYEKEVEDLLDSCKSLSIDYHIEEREDLGSWEKNCAQKPLYIFECLQKFNEPLLWVDSDAIILKNPDLDLKNCDIALYFSEPLHARNGTIYTRPTKNARKFMRIWHEELLRKNREHGKKMTPDQPVMNELIRANKISDLKIGNLGIEYTQVFDRDPVPIDRTVILHFQASRTAKMHPLLWKNLRGADLKAMRIKNSEGHHGQFNGFQ